VSWSGSSSASSSNPFFVRASHTKALKVGLFFYTDLGAGASPFFGGTLCVNSAHVRRSPPLVDSVGTPGLCDGVLQIDVNAFAHGLLGGSPLPSLLTPGTRIHCQFWGRDVPSYVLLSNALEFVVCP
jgi:hypothetical protein